jgi:hypothetical protein
MTENQLAQLLILAQVCTALEFYYKSGSSIFLTGPHERISSGYGGSDRGGDEKYM